MSDNSIRDYQLRNTKFITNTRIREQDDLFNLGG